MTTPDLDIAFVRARLDRPLAELESPREATRLLRPEAPAPISTGPEVAAAIRDLLRAGGYRPAGRGKPASEYLLRAAAEGTLSSVNLLVDVNNAVSLHSGLPVSVIDLSLSPPPRSIRVGGPGESYVFNKSGQTIAVEGLICLYDGEGPCANAVKDSQRTKTGPGTQEALYVIWGSRRLPGRTRAAAGWMLDLLRGCGVCAEEAFPDGAAFHL